MDKEATCKATNSTVGGINKKIFANILFHFSHYAFKDLKFDRASDQQKGVEHVCSICKVQSLQVLLYGWFWFKGVNGSGLNDFFIESLLS